MLQQTRTSPNNHVWNGLEIISRGANRLCVRDPDDPAYCLKYELPTSQRSQVSLRQRLRRGLAQRFPNFGENRTELRAYRRLQARLHNGLDGVVATCHGLIATPQGEALRCGCVLLQDGTPARSLYRHLFGDRAYPADMLCEAVDRFEAWLLRHGVPLFDLNAGNFVVVPQGDGVALVCIDSKSLLIGKEILPFSRWSRLLMRRKIARRCERLRQRIRAALAGDATLAGPRPPH
jgi:hypothetical protein